VSRQCSHLTEVGYVTKTADPRDGRAQLIALTSSGRRLVDQGRTARRAAMSELLGAWPAEDIADFARLIDRFNQDLTRVHDQQTGESR
jgi:DNA-binding MarR family transcriptional regulator